MPKRIPPVILLIATLLISCVGGWLLADEKSAEPSGTPGSLDLHRRLADEFTNLDPGETGWQSESLSETISNKMKSVAKWLVHPEELAPEKLEALITDDFTTGPLLHTKLTRLNDGRSMAISQAAPDAAQPESRGVGGFESALSALSAVFSGAVDRRAKFKVMHVVIEPEGASTKLLFEIRGRKPESGWTQITSTWHCAWTTDASPKLRSVRVSDFRMATPGSSGRIEFSDAAPAVLAGVEGYEAQLTKSFDYWRARSDKSLVADLLGAQGVVVGDVNGDQMDDLYVLQPGGLPNRLFIHQPDGSARDSSAEAGVDILDFCRSALMIDLDNDGDQDLAVGLAWKLLLMENDGSGKFTPRGQIDSDGQINSMAAADYDNDGKIDIYLCGRDASGAIKAEQGALGIPMPYYDANNGGPNTLLRNLGEFVFADVTRRVGLDTNNRRFSLACAWEDFDNDGDQDLYVSNDFGRNNLFRNDGPMPDGQIKFTDIAEQAGVVDIGPGMSAAWGDHNNDGHPDLYVGNMWSNAGNRITLQKQFLPGADDSTKQQARRHARGNSVYISNGDGTFKDVTRESGANMARWAWSSNFIDLDNDGRQDLVVANGMITTADTGDL